MEFRQIGAGGLQVIEAEVLPVSLDNGVGQVVLPRVAESVRPTAFDPVAERDPAPTTVPAAP